MQVGHWKWGPIACGFNTYEAYVKCLKIYYTWNDTLNNFTEMHSLHKIKTEMPKIIWKQATSPHLVADLVDPLIAIVLSRWAVFATRRQCARPSNTRFLGLSPLTIHICSISSAVIFLWLMQHSPYTLHCVTPFPHICPLVQEGLDRHLTHRSLCPLNPLSQMAYRTDLPFLQNTQSLSMNGQTS